MWCEVSVYDELYIYDQGVLDTDLADVKQAVYKRFNWYLVGWPTIETGLPSDDGDWSETKSEDIEQSGIINAGAKDDIEINTQCGTAKSVMSRGAYMSDYALVSQFTRQGRTDSSEQLLIGTIYSQYNARHLVLSGTANAVEPLQGLKLFTDANTDSKQYLIAEEVYDVISDESEVTLTEVSGDNYTTD